jgi:RNA polymerase sigma-70 factor (ECF subfamily)
MGGRRAAELAARQSFGKLVAWLTARCGDVAAAEDALGDAFLAALRCWPVEGVPRAPEAWLLVVARRRLIDRARRGQTLERLLPELDAAAPGIDPDAPENAMEFPDERLRLLFLCAHPAIDPGIQAPLMLQTVLGLNASRIAAAFLVAPATMGQRLVRAKAKIREARIPFVLPPAEALPARSAAVLQAIYAAYTTGWDGQGDGGHDRGLAQEAVLLARLCVALLPEEPEARGLLALLLHCEARHGARRAADGTYVPLLEQDPALWDGALLAEAEAVLSQASRAGRPGRFQLEAAIQSLHAHRAVSGVVDWPALLGLYDGLLALAPSAGARVSRTAVLAELAGPERALAELEALATADPPLRQHQPWWALRAHLLQGTGQAHAAREAYGRAIDLAEDPAVRAFLRRRAGAAPPAPLPDDPGGHRHAGRP